MLIVMNKLLPIVGFAFFSLVSTTVFSKDFDYQNETVGALKIGLTEEQVAKAVPLKFKRGPSQLMGADGKYHQEWVNAQSGVTLDMTSESKAGAKTIESITIKPPCTWATSRGIRINSTAEEVRKAYKAEINKTESKSSSGLVIGSLFGGLVTEIKDGKVVGLFVGAASE